MADETEAVRPDRNRGVPPRRVQRRARETGPLEALPRWTRGPLSPLWSGFALRALRPGRPRRAGEPLRPAGAGRPRKPLGPRGPRMMRGFDGAFAVGREVAPAPSGPATSATTRAVP